MKALTKDPVLAAEIQARLNIKSLYVAVKLFQQGVKLLTDMEATDVVDAGDLSAQFSQEVSIMSALQGHASVVGLIGYT